MAGSLATFAVAAEYFSLVSYPDGVRVSRYRAKISCDIHGDFEVFLNRVCHSRFSAVDRTPNPQSDPAAIIRHRIVKPRLVDELGALYCFRCRRPRAWRDANAMLRAFHARHIGDKKCFVLTTVKMPPLAPPRVVVRAGLAALRATRFGPKLNITSMVKVASSMVTSVMTQGLCIPKIFFRDRCRASTQTSRETLT